MCENRDFVVPVNILTPFARALFSWATRHTTVCLDWRMRIFTELYLMKFGKSTIFLYKGVEFLV